VLESKEEDDGINEEEVAQNNTEMAEDYIPETQPIGQQYFVDAQFGNDHPSSESSNIDVEVTDILARRNLFPLSQIQQLHHKQKPHGEPLIDYSESIIMILEDYIATMMAKATRKEVSAKEREEQIQA